MTSKRVREWLVAAAAGAVHGVFWFLVAREMRVDTAIGEGPVLLGLIAAVLGGVSVLAFVAARPLRPWSYAGVVAAVAAGGFAVAVSEDLLGLDLESPLIPIAIGFLVGTSLASYLVWMIAHPRWSLWILTVCAGFAGGVGAGIAVAEPPPPRDVYVEPDLGAVEFPEWKMGDVHVHAAGDRDLVKHPDCRRGDRFLEGLECARALVGITAEAAAKANAKWVILVEHGAWLSGGRDFDLEKGIEEWDHLRAAAEELARATGVRMLMGEELGTAGVSFAGHFSAYSTPSYVPNSARRIPDVRYVEGVASLGGWGAINHPFQGGNKWECWYPGEDCGDGVVAFAAPAAPDPAAFRAIELTNGGRFPAEETLAMWDELLVQGYEIWGVGGSDAHSRSVELRDLLHGGPGVANLAKIGISRTYALVPEDVAPAEGYAATDPDDPVRRAIYSGAVVASNGPRALAVVDDAGPGQTATVPPGDVTVQVGIKWPATFTSEHPDPARVRVTYSKIAPGCGDACPRALVVERDVPPDADAMTVPLAIPSEWERAYVRVEVVTDGEKPMGAFVSPIFVERGAAAAS